MAPGWCSERSSTASACVRACETQRPHGTRGCSPTAKGCALITLASSRTLHSANLDHRGSYDAAFSGASIVFHVAASLHRGGAALCLFLYQLYVFTAGTRYVIVHCAREPEPLRVFSEPRTPNECAVVSRVGWRREANSDGGRSTCRRVGTACTSLLLRPWSLSSCLWWCDAAMAHYGEAEATLSHWTDVSLRLTPLARR